MLLSIQQRYILEALKKLGCVRRRQLHALVQNKFPRMRVSGQSMDAMVRQLRCGNRNIQADVEFVGLPGVLPDHRRLEAVDIMLELSENRLGDFSARCESPELLRFSLEGASLRLFTVATASDPLCSIGRARDSPGRMVWISDSGSTPPGLSLPPKHFFAVRQPDGSHRFYGS